MRRDTQVEMESAVTRREASIEGEESSATTHEQSMPGDEETGQHTVPEDDDLPGAPSEPPPPLTSPDEPARRENEPPSVELEGERRGNPSCDADATGVCSRVEDNGKRQKNLENASERIDEPLEQKDEGDSPEGALDELDAPGDKADASPASGRVEDDGERPMRLRNASERISQRSKRRSQKDSPEEARGDPDEPGGETVVPGGLQAYQEGPTSGASEDGGETSASDRDTGPGGHRGEEESSRVVEGESDRESVVDRAEYDRIRPIGDRDERGGDTNLPGRDRGPGCWLGEQDESGGVADDRERQSDGDSVGNDGRRGRMDGAASGARRDSKRVETKTLTGGKGQIGQNGHNETSDVPESSRQSTRHPRRPMHQPNPPRRRGRLKLRPTSIITSKWTYQVIRTRRGRIGRIGRVEHVVYGL